MTTAIAAPAASRSPWHAMEAAEATARLRVLHGAARHPGVLAVARRRLGCSCDKAIDQAVDALLEFGEVDMPSGHGARLVAFGLPQPHGPRPRGFQVVSLLDAAGHVRAYLSRNGAAVRHVHGMNPTLAWLALRERVRRAEARGGGVPRAVGGSGIVR